MGKKIRLIIKKFYYETLLLIKVLKERINKLLTITSAIACLISFITLVLEFALPFSTETLNSFTILHSVVMYYFLADVIIRLVLLTPNKWSYLITRPTDSVVFFPYIILLPIIPFAMTFFVSQILLLLLVLGRIHHLQLLLEWLKIRPAQIIIFAFLFFIFTGALLLSLPQSTTLALPLSFIDALFTSCSAVCVTGLTINNIGYEFSLFGQLIILGLIQLGGLGIMSFSVLLTLVLRRRISQSDSLRLQENYATVNLKETISAIGFIFKFTLLFEALGAILLTFFWMDEFNSLAHTIYIAIFHSISAFCNAGFSLFDHSLIPYQTHFPIVMIISTLIILGGLGFPVLYNISQKFNGTSTTKHLKIQTKIALSVTLGLIIAGTCLIYFTEYNRTLSDFSITDKLQIAYFQSVSARTAGFSTTDISMFHPSSIMVILVLMIIGASPGSTGGGIKTTTFGLILIAFFNVLKSSFRFDIFKKTIDPKSIIQAFSVVLTSLLLILGFYFLLLNIESLETHPILFEVISAFGTVGLSLGITDQLSLNGKLLIIITMFIGRIGPFTFLYAFFRQNQKKPYAYPVEKVSIL